MNEGPNHSLVTIKFDRIVDGTHPDAYRCTRYWYHVPRVGDEVDFGEASGTVRTVFWMDDCVIVRFR